MKTELAEFDDLKSESSDLDNLMKGDPDEDEDDEDDDDLKYLDDIKSETNDSEDFKSSSTSFDTEDMLLEDKLHFKLENVIPFESLDDVSIEFKLIFLCSF